MRSTNADYVDISCAPPCEAHPFKTYTVALDPDNLNESYKGPVLLLDFSSISLICRNGALPTLQIFCCLLLSSSTGLLLCVCKQMCVCVCRCYSVTTNATTVSNAQATQHTKSTVRFTILRIRGWQRSALTLDVRV